MTAVLDFTDLPLVAPEHLAVPMRMLIDSRRGLALLRGLSEAELRELDQAVWDRMDGDPVQRLAVVLRFRCLVEVFSAPRLQSMLLYRGFNLIAPALVVAAQMRLNAETGFNPHIFARALERMPADGDHAPASAAAPELHVA